MLILFSTPITFYATHLTVQIGILDNNIVRSYKERSLCYNSAISKDKNGNIKTMAKYYNGLTTDFLKKYSLIIVLVKMLHRELFFLFEANFILKKINAKKDCLCLPVNSFAKREFTFSFFFLSIFSEFYFVPFAEF